MDYIKKFIVLSFFSPLFFILFLVYGGFIGVATIFYLFSLAPFVDRVERTLEARVSEASEEEIKRGKYYVVLGTGIIEDYRGEIEPSKDGLQRIIYTFFLYKRDRKKIIVSGGKSYTRDYSEAEIYGKVLKRLGVLEGDIIFEEKSRTTSENAQNVSQMLEHNKNDEVILITNAIHMPRALMWFERYKINVIPVPCGYAGERRRYGPLDYLPNFYAIYRLMNVLKEYNGILKNILLKKKPCKSKPNGKRHS